MKPTKEELLAVVDGQAEMTPEIRDALARLIARSEQVDALVDASKNLFEVSQTALGYLRRLKRDGDIEGELSGRMVDGLAKVTESYAAALKAVEEG